MTNIRKEDVQYLRRASQIIFFFGLVILTLGGFCALVVGDITFACPLGALQLTLATRELFMIIIAGALIWVVAAIIVGRAFCGWACPIGTIIDFVDVSLEKLKFVPILNSKPAGIIRNRVNKYLVLLASLIVATAIGRIIFCALCPIGTVCRSVGGRCAGPEIATVGLVAGAGFMERRAFCKYLCPVGAVFAIMDKVSIFKVKVPTYKCVECNECDNSCPMGLSIVEETKEKFAKDPRVVQLAKKMGVTTEELLIKMPNGSKNALMEIGREYHVPKMECIKCYVCPGVCPTEFTTSPDIDHCSGCGICSVQCPFDAITMEEKGDKREAVVDADKCRGCGSCVAACPTYAMDQDKWTNKYIESNVERILAT